MIDVVATGGGFIIVQRWGKKWKENNHFAHRLTVICSCAASDAVGAAMWQARTALLSDLHSLRDINQPASANATVETHLGGTGGGRRCIAGDYWRICKGQGGQLSSRP